MKIAALSCLLLLLAWQFRRQRYALTLLLASASAAVGWHYAPFPDPLDNPLLTLIADQRPGSYAVLKGTWAAVLFLLPAYGWFTVISRKLRNRVVVLRRVDAGTLPPYPDPRARNELFVILGELHHQSSMEPSLTPRWCEIPEAGLSRGVMVLGAIGTGKTSSCLLPIADQVLGFAAHDRSQRAGGLVLEVKMDFCRQIRSVLESHGRDDDYMEIGYQSPYCYNPLHNEASPATLAHRLISVLRIISGHSGGKDSEFWDRAAQGYATFLIHVHRLLYGYVTFRDLYLASSSIDVVDKMMKQAADALSLDYILLAKEDYLELPKKGVERFDRQMDLTFHAEGDSNIRLIYDADLEAFLESHKVEFKRVGSVTDPEAEKRREAYESAKVYHKKLKALSQELRTNVAETLNVALYPFDMDAEARRIFCPPAAAYDPVLNRDGKLGRPLPPLERLVESPRVLALALPVAVDEKVARIAGVLLKQDWQRAVLLRKGSPGWDARRSRRLLMLIDEYHLLATGGGEGDEKFLNLCRDVGCLPVVATQSLSSLRATVGNDAEAVITQALQTTICMRQKDAVTADWISRMVGRQDILREHWGVSEGQQGVVPSVTGALVAPSGNMSISRGWNEVRDSIFEPQVVHQLPDGVAIATVYNGFTMQNPTFLYLQQYGQDHAISWFTANKDKRKTSS